MENDYIHMHIVFHTYPSNMAAQSSLTVSGAYINAYTKQKEVIEAENKRKAAMAQAVYKQMMANEKKAAATMTPLLRDESNQAFWANFDAIIKAYYMTAPTVLVSTDEKAPLVGLRGEYVVIKDQMSDPFTQWFKLHAYKERHENKDENHHRLGALSTAYWKLSFDEWIIMAMSHLSASLFHCKADQIIYIRGVLAIFSKAGCGVHYVCVSVPKISSIYTHIKVVRSRAKDISGDKNLDVKHGISRGFFLRKVANVAEHMRHLEIYLPVLADDTTLTFQVGNVRIIKDPAIKVNYKAAVGDVGED